MNRKLLFFGVILAFVLTACKNAKPVSGEESGVEEDSLEMADELSDEEEMDELISETPMPVAAEELFDDFLFNFAANKKLQMARVVFPLSVKKGDRLLVVGERILETDGNAALVICA